MGFVALLIALAAGVLIAGMLTSILRGIVLALSGLGIIFYFFIADPAMKTKLDEAASKVSFSEFSSIDFADIDKIISEANKETKAKIEEALKKHGQGN